MCSETAQMCCNIDPFINAIKIIISIVQWSVPLLLIVLGTIDMFKAVASNDEKATTAAKSTFIKRLAYGVAIFLVPFVVNLILGLMEDNIVKDKEVLNDNWLSCWNGSIDCDKCDKIYENDYNTNNGNNNTGTGSGNNNSDITETKTCYVYEITNSSCDSSDLTEYEKRTLTPVPGEDYCEFYTEEATTLSDGESLCSLACMNSGNYVKYNYNNNGTTATCKCATRKIKTISILYSANQYLNFSEYKKYTYSCTNPLIDCSDGSFAGLSSCKLVD